MNHNILLSILEFYGIVCKTNTLIKSYLNGRYQRVMIDTSHSNSSIYSDWVKIKNCVPQGSILGPLFFLFYINDLPGIITDISQLVLFADDTGILISKPSHTEFINDINKVFGKINDWFKINLLSLNFDKTYYVQFMIKNIHEINIHISYGNKLITNTQSTNFLGLIIDSTLSWKNHIDKLMPKLSSPCYAIRAVKSLMTQESLRIIYFSYFHSVMTYGINFWGNSSYCSNIFKIQKRIIRIITNSQSRVSCRDLFKKLKILPLPSQYIYFSFIICD
jgi:hypothetical protein